VSLVQLHAHLPVDAMDDTLLVALAAPVSALLGAALGAVGAYTANRQQAATALSVARQQVDASRDTAHHQVEASTIVASRQRWIDELRADLSNMNAAFLKLHFALQQQSPAGEREWRDELIRATILESKIALMLNPNHSHHQVLLAAVASPMNNLRAGKPVNWEEASLATLQAGQEVLKEAWDQLRAEVKRQPSLARRDISTLGA
jgi:hypothetical protein